MTDISGTERVITVAKVVQGGVGVGASSGTAYGLVIILQLLASHWGLTLTEGQANALIPLITVIVHPWGMLFSALMTRLIRKVSGED